MEDKKRKSSGLGRGIEALFADNAVDTSKEEIHDLAVDAIMPNPYQPRHQFDESKLADLTASIKESGVFQPVIVRRPNPEINAYELLTGERRLRASRLAGLSAIPGIVREASDEEMMEIAVVENLQREDLTPLEEAEAYNALMTKLNLTQAEVANRLGKSRPYIANYLRILGLPEKIKDLLQEEKISMGQARTLLGLENKNQIPELAAKTVKNGMTVRELEREVARLNAANHDGETKKNRIVKTPFVKESENQLQEHFGTKVSINPTNKKKGEGKIEIAYMSDDDLNRILDLLNVNLD
ncbi:ParB/RepB/Spo0J family partition protein [Lentilactobacillus senioris]|uniref:ParB/RepB/Spo0J family partition protein n=1 Tax=Lentilactobacillus senioris TaxID=931534 RepID=UPI00227EF62B|nr:ParB/RepB/Spo0J family partition protein [Lentilactobacillus senioris]MCY9807354.1 ParB/RepB/Spo0J family partition protein [Lentilactobacillus senioris]